MIKLQLLLRHPGPDPVIGAALRAALTAHGLLVTACGRASVSVELTSADFDRLFGGAADPSALPVPAALSDAITLITAAPRHCRTRHSPKGKHAAI